MDSRLAINKPSAFDIETYVDTYGFLRPYCLCYCIAGLEGEFYGKECVEDFLSFLLALKKSSVIYAHNLTFDGTFVTDALSKRGVLVNALVIRCSFYYIEFTNDVGKKITIKCSYKFLPLPLSKLSLFLDAEEKLSFDHKKVGQDNFMQKDIRIEVLAYCKRDVQIVCDLISLITESLRDFPYDWQLRSNSISSISLNFFKLFYNTHKISLVNNLKNDALFRLAYYGSRVEVVGNAWGDKEDTYTFDYSGMYNQTMQEKYPYGSWKLEENPKDSSKPGIYNITFTCDLQLPFLPYRDKLSKKLLFPNGKISGWYTSEEVNFAISLGYKVDLKGGITFTKTGYVFKEFASEMLKHRKKNANNKFIFKLINNSLYGRLGLGFDDIKTKLMSREECESIDIKSIKKKIEINNYCLVDIRTTPNNKTKIKSNVMYAAMITAKARIKLYKGFISVQKHGGRLLYTDTDSIFAAFPKGTKVLDIEMGDVIFKSTEAETVIQASVFVLPKTYGVRYADGKEKIVIKGVTNPKISFDELEKKFYQKENAKFNQAQLQHKKDFYFKEANLIKLINLNTYTKRIFSENKKETKPITIAEVSVTAK